MYGLDIDCPRCSVHYRLSAGEIARTVELWRQGGSVTEEDFARICSQLLCGRSKKALGEISYPTVRFKDLKVPDEAIRYSIWESCLPAEQFWEPLDMDYQASSSILPEV